MNESLYQLLFTRQQVEDLLMALISAETQARWHRTDVARGADIDAYRDLQQSIDRQCKEQEDGIVTKIIKQRASEERP